MTIAPSSPRHALSAVPGLRLPLGLRFDEGEGSGGGTATQPPSPPPAPAPGAPVVNVKLDKEFIDKLVGENKAAGVDLTAKVKIGDKMVPLTDLIGKAQQADAMAAVAQEYEKLKGHIANAYASGDKFDAAKAKEGMLATLKTAGLSETEAAAEVEEIFKDAPAAGTQPGQQPGGGKKTVEDLRVKAIEEHLHERIETAAFKPFGEHEILKPIMVAKRKMMDEETRALMVAGKTDEAGKVRQEFETFEQEWKDQAIQDLHRRLQARRQKEGTFSIRWVEEEGKKTADTIASKLRRATGDPRYMGKAPATAAESPYSVLEKPPVEKPKGEYGKTSVQDLDAKFTEYGVDKLMREVAERELGKAGSAI